MQSSNETPLRVVVLADSDTRWKWGALTATRLADEVRVSGRLLRGRATPTPRQLAEVGVETDLIRGEVSAAAFLREMREDPSAYDVVVLALVGGGVQALLHGLREAWRDAPRRPLVVTGYVGVVYEKLADGLLLRHGADVVVANSAYDASRFRAVYEGVGADASSVVEAALPFLDGKPYEADLSRPYTVTFAVQPSVPDNTRDRRYLLGRAASHARRHPERNVLVKLRSRPGEHTTHIEEAPYQKLAQRADLPANCRLVYGHMGEVLDRTDLLVTVSSTAALESLHRGIPTAVLTDLGIREPLGNHHFLGSGCLASWSELDQGLVPSPAADWLAGQGVRTSGAFDALRKKVAALRAARLPEIAPYYDHATAPGYLPGLLARHHLSPDGTPLPGAPAEQRPAGGVRRLVREAARGAYRHGVQRVAPVIRRIGEL